MNKAAIIKANSRLRLAKKAVEELKQCRTIEGFNDAWYAFLTASKNVYTVLEQGAKASAQSRQWFGTKNQERRADQLLQYVYQARNDDEHGLEPIAKHVPGSLAIGVAKPGFSQHVQLDMINGVIKTESLDGMPILIEQTLPHVALVTVTGRGNVKFPPPEMHLGKKLESNLPVPVAELAISYLEGLIAEGSTLA